MDKREDKVNEIDEITQLIENAQNIDDNIKDIKQEEKEDESVSNEFYLTTANAEGAVIGTVEQEKNKEEKGEEGKGKEENKKEKVFQMFKIKDIVFLAIMSACMLVTGAIMPLVTQIPIFGIIELCLGLQFSIFPVIGLMKVRKPGSLIFMSLFCSIVFAFMFLPMVACVMVCAVICEALALLIFRGYKKDVACVFTTTLYFPMTLPFLYIWYNLIYTINTAEDGKAVQAFVGADAGFAVGITFAVIAICLVGSLIGMVISREMKRAGVMKK